MNRFLLCTTLLTAVIWAQGPSPQPDPEIKKLDFFAGSWTTTGKMPPGPMGPGGPVTSSEQYSWQDGHYFVVGQSRYVGPMGKGTELHVFGYDATRKLFTFEGFGSDGVHEVATGTTDGSSWTWTSDQPNASFKWRYLQKVESPRSFTSTFEMSQDGTHWTRMLETTSTKQ